MSNEGAKQREKTTTAASVDEVVFTTHNKRLVYATLVVLNIVVQYDTGALAALMADQSKDGIAAKFGMSQTQKGLLGSVAHLGVCTGCLISGELLSRYKARHLLIVACIVNTITAWLFSLSTSFVLLIVCRVLNGVSQSFLIVYAPIWTDEFAPQSGKSTWMAFSEAGGPLGIVIGYLTSGFLTAGNVEWRVAFYIQASLLAVLTVAVLPIKSPWLQVVVIDCGKVCDCDDILTEPSNDSEWKRVVEVLSNPDTSDVGIDDKRQRVVVIASPLGRDFTSPKPPSTVMSPPPEDTRNPWIIVASSSLVWVALLALSSLYFVLTGITMWVTDYLTQDGSPIDVGYSTVIISFGLCAATAPVFGVIAGGVILDKMGGYQGKLHRAAALGVGFGLFAVAASYVSLAMTNFVAFMVCIWLLIAAGGATVPSLIGIIVSAVSKRLRCVCLRYALNSLRHLLYSFAKTVSTVLGFFLGPFACGVIADFWTLTWGMRIVIGWSAVAEVFLLLTWLQSYRRKEELSEVNLLVEDPDLVTSIRASIFAMVQGTCATIPDARRISQRHSLRNSQAHSTTDSPLLTHSLKSLETSVSKLRDSLVENSPDAKTAVTVIKQRELVESMSADNVGVGVDEGGREGKSFEV